MNVRKYEILGKDTMYLVEIHGEEFLIHDGTGEQVGHGAVSATCGVEWVSTDFNEQDFENLNACLEESIKEI